MTSHIGVDTPRELAQPPSRLLHQGCPNGLRVQGPGSRVQGPPRSVRFLPHDRYLIPDELYGQHHQPGDETDPYLRVNESAGVSESVGVNESAGVTEPLPACERVLRVNESAVYLADGLMLGEENEEYEAGWSSDWRTSAPGPLGGAFDASAPPQGGAARYGPLSSFPYRYLLSSLRLLQMRVSYLLASTVVVTPALYAYVALELGQSADDAIDCWCFLVSTEFAAGRGRVSR